MARVLPTRRQRLLVRAGFVTVLALPVAFTAWLLLSPPDPAPDLTAIESLPVPSSWEVVHTQTQRSFLGSRADRDYLVDAEPQDIAPVAGDVLRSAGFEIYQQVASSDWCDTRPIGASPAMVCPVKEVEPCQENGRGGPITCFVTGFRWLSQDPPLLERLTVVAMPRADQFLVGVGDEQHLVRGSNRVLVTITADRTAARSFWSSPTPPSSGRLS